MTSSSTTRAATAPTSVPAAPEESVKEPSKAPAQRQTESAAKAVVKAPNRATTKRSASPSARRVVAPLGEPIGGTRVVKDSAKTVMKSVSKPAQKEVASKKEPGANKPATTKPGTSKTGKPKTAPRRAQKIKMVRDSFTFPEAEHRRLVELKKRLISLGTEVKKGELVRAGLHMLFSLEDSKLVIAVAGVEKLKTGRPKK